MLKAFGKMHLFMDLKKMIQYVKNGIMFLLSHCGFEQIFGAHHLFIMNGGTDKDRTLPVVSLANVVVVVLSQLLLPTTKN